VDVLLGVVLFLLVAVAMEGVAYLTHRHVMHGWLWSLHRDHHNPKGRGWQKNDLFALFFATISFTLILFGALRSSAPLTGAGAGMALYGVGYTLFHDVMFHKRLRRVRLRPSTPYLRRIYDAHSRHHRSNRKENGVSFGFLYARAPHASDVAARGKGSRP
jgi:beta-carotene 3-hydroxylase